MAKVTIGGLRRIIREELEKAMEEIGGDSPLKKYYELHAGDGIEYHRDYEDPETGDHYEEVVLDGGPFNNDTMMIGYSENGEVYLNGSDGPMPINGNPSEWPSPDELFGVEDEDDFDTGEETEVH